MAEPTLRDILEGITRLEKAQSELRTVMATKADLADVRSQVADQVADVRNRR